MNEVSLSLNSQEFFSSVDGYHNRLANFGLQKMESKLRRKYLTKQDNKYKLTPKEEKSIMDLVQNGLSDESSLYKLSFLSQLTAIVGNELAKGRTPYQIIDQAVANIRDHFADKNQPKGKLRELMAQFISLEDVKSFFVDPVKALSRPDKYNPNCLQLALVYCQVFNSWGIRCQPFQYAVGVIPHVGILLNNEKEPENEQVIIFDVNDQGEFAVELKLRRKFNAYFTRANR